MNKINDDDDDDEYIILSFESLYGADQLLLPNEAVVSEMTYCNQVAQLSKRDRAAEWVSFGQKWKTIGLKDDILRTL